VLTIQHENQRIFLKEKRTFEPDLFLSQAARRYGCERTAYSLCSLDHTTHFLLAPWNTRKSCQKQSGAHGGKCAPTTTTHHPQAAGETAACTKTDRILLVLLARAVRAWKQTLFLVQPETLLRWHRELFRLYWKRRSKASSHKPKVAAETIALIREMATENRLWGCTGYLGYPF
jgi:hypothetical protein